MNQLVRLAFSYVLHHAFALFWHALLPVFGTHSESKPVNCAVGEHISPRGLLL